MLTRQYSGVAAYCQSKLAQILFTVDLAEELSGLGRDRQCPASLDLHEHDDGAPRRHVAHEQGRDGAEAILQLAVSPTIEGKSGLYFNV